MTSLENMNTEAVEYVRGIPVVKVFQQTVFSFKNFHKSITEYKHMVFGYTRMWEKPMSAYTVIVNSFVFLLVPIALLIINHSGDVAQDGSESHSIRVTYSGVFPEYHAQHVSESGLGAGKRSC